MRVVGGAACAMKDFAVRAGFTPRPRPTFSSNSRFPSAATRKLSLRDVTTI